MGFGRPTLRLIINLAVGVNVEYAVEAIASFALQQEDPTVDPSTSSSERINNRRGCWLLPG